MGLRSAPSAASATRPPDWLGRTRRRSTIAPFLAPFITIVIFGLVVLALGQP
jgi:hypothetical protein